MDIEAAEGRDVNHLLRQELPEGGDLPARLQAAVEFLTGVGYLASAEEGEDGQYLLCVANCPYEQVARRHPQPCRIDAGMIARMLGVSLERLETIVEGDDRCIYVLPPDEPSF